MNTALQNRPIVVPSRGGSTSRRVLAGMLMPAVTAAIAVVGIRVRVPGGLPDLQVVAFGLILVGALSGAVLARARERVPQWQVAFGALTASIALTAARIGDEAPAGQHQAARGVATLAAPFVIALSCHLLLALPDGRLGGQGRRAGAGLAYAAAAGTGLALAIAGRPFPAWAAAPAWSLAAACALPAVRLRYLTTAGRDRERMQWMSVGAVLAADTALVVAVLHVLVSWPGPVAAAAAGSAIFLPLGMMAGELRALGPHGGRGCATHM